ncbi:MAG: RHS repeat-associated core domain-containing protein, partial [Candidatus Thiodiazotropha endolucinida]
QPDSIWTTDPIYQKTTQGYAYYQNDHLGTTQQLIQRNGAKAWEGNYRAFGELTTETGTWENRLRFPGQYYDQETNNYYNYFRDYDPSTGRYVQEDPIGLRGGYNTYIYVHDNPLRYIDPTGEIAPAAAAAAAAIARCYVTCIGVAAVMDAATGSCDLKNSAKDCALDCLLPWNWFKSGNKFGAKAGKSKKPKKTNRPRGSWRADKGAREYDRRHNTGRRGRDAFHEIKQDSPWPGGREPWSVNPDTGDVFDPSGNHYDNLNNYL